MASIRTVLSLVLLGSLSMSAQADIYKYIDKDGNLVLTDQAVPGATKIKEQPVMTIPALPSTKLDPKPKKTAAGSVSYTITITSPAPNATYQRNSGDTVPLAVSVDPALKAGDNLQILLDSSPYDGNSLPLDQLERGSHSVSAEVVTSDGKVVQQGASVTFFIQQFSPLNHQDQNTNQSPYPGSTPNQGLAPNLLTHPKPMMP